MMMASKHSPNPRDMYPACIPHVSRMYLACVQHVSWLPLRIHVSRMYPACILHVSRMYPACIPSYQIHLSPDAFEIHVSHYVSHYVSRMYPVCILITSEDTCILHVSRMYLAPQIRTSLHTFEIHVSHDVSLMYPACILYVSWNHCRYMYPACIPHKSLHVSHIYSSWRVQDTCIVILYLGVSWCIVMKIPRYTYPDVSWHVSSVTSRKRPRYMYRNVSHVYPKMYLGLVWDTCEIQAQCEGYMYSLGM